MTYIYTHTLYVCIYMYTYKIHEDHPEPQAHRCLYVKRQHVTLITACGLHT